MAYILGLENLTDWILHGNLYFSIAIKVHYQLPTSYLCNEHGVNYLFVEAVQKSFDESPVREYCGYT